MSTEQKHAHLAKARAAAAVKRELRKFDDDKALKAWREWLHKEAEAYASYRRARDGEHPLFEVTKLYHNWHSVLRAEPKRPGADAFRRERGEADSEDE